MTCSFSPSPGKDVTQAVGDRTQAGLGAATPGVEPVHEDTEPRTDAPAKESAAAEGTKKKPAPAKRKRAAAAKRGQTEGTGAPKSAPLAPARQPLPPSEGCACIYSVICC